MEHDLFFLFFVEDELHLGADVIVFEESFQLLDRIGGT